MPENCMRPDFYVHESTRGFHHDMFAEVCSRYDRFRHKPVCQQLWPWVTWRLKVCSFACCVSRFACMRYFVYVFVSVLFSFCVFTVCVVPSISFCLFVLVRCCLFCVFCRPAVRRPIFAISCPFGVRRRAADAHSVTQLLLLENNLAPQRVTVSVSVGETGRLVRNVFHPFCQPAPACRKRRVGAKIGQTAAARAHHRKHTIKNTKNARNEKYRSNSFFENAKKSTPKKLGPGFR